MTLGKKLKDVRQLFQRAPFTSGAWDLSQLLIVHWQDMGYITDSSSVIFFESFFGCSPIFLCAFQYTLLSFFITHHKWLKYHRLTTILYLYHHISNWLLTFQLDYCNTPYLQIKTQPYVIYWFEIRQHFFEHENRWACHCCWILNQDQNLSPFFTRLISATKTPVTVGPLTTWMGHRKSSFLRSEPDVQPTVMKPFLKEAPWGSRRRVWGVLFLRRKQQQKQIINWPQPLLPNATGKEEEHKIGSKVREEVKTWRKMFLGFGFSSHYPTLIELTKN